MTGLAAGFVAQFAWRQARSLAEIVAAAVYIHGLAGDLATDHLGEMSMLAGDLLEHIPDALQAVAHVPSEQRDVIIPDLTP